jgi:magnesium-protoporphyrin IX monomethyl ester (oxidative) cyclase
MEKYFAARAPFSRLFRHERNTSIQTSRGCPAHCTFCSSARYWGHDFRSQSVPRVLAEMEHLAARYGIRELQFVDDNLIFDRDRARAIFQGMIDRKFNFSWCMPNGVALWRLDLELLNLMARAGCYSLTLAFESGNQQVLSRIVKKPLNLSKVDPLIAEMKRLDLQVHAFFISGFPGESVAAIHDTYRLAQRLELDGAYFFIATPLPGSELCERGQAEGHLPADLDFTAIEYNKGWFNTDEWSAAEVERLTGRFYLKFMLAAFARRPLRFLRNYGRLILSRPWYTLSHLLTFLKRRATEKKAN